ncbi:hypothetical protein BDV96DRAFT_88239 [Lophiotrema nucula]|uniref:Uncharacterized protein n=1 Tax=Lophiotrema nucula TaxID=690887 RepID=A0A6A5Z944_9PLEO|nr:hypothetical protein BDV96DRAFT_88239 [Lophiotrema nucula]
MIASSWVFAVLVRTIRREVYCLYTFVFVSEQLSVTAQGIVSTTRFLGDVSSRESTNITNMDLKLDNYVLAFPKAEATLRTMPASSPPEEQIAPEFLTPSSVKVQELPPTERKKALQLALRLKTKFRRYSESEWNHHDHEEEPVCGFLEEEDPETEQWSPSLQSPESYEDSQADLYKYWANPESPIKLHHDKTPAKPSIKFEREGSASSGKTNGTPPGTLPMLGALRGARDRQRRPTLNGVFTPPAVPERRPTLQSMASAPALPIAALDALVRPRSRRPTLKDIVSTSAVPPAMPEMSEMGYQRRPTLRDMVLGGLPSPPPNAALPPDPFSLKRAATYDSAHSTLVNDGRLPSNGYQFTTKPQGNAFAQPGFWESIGAEEPKPVVRKRDDLLHPKPPKTPENDENDITPWLEVDQPLESATFSTSGFLKAMGRKLTKVPTNETHPFTEIMPPTDSASRDAYNQVLEALQAYWYSTAIVRGDTPDGDHPQYSAQPDSTQRPGTAFSTASKTSALRKLTSRTALMIQARPAIDIPKSSPKVSALPASPTSKKQGKRKLWDTPVFDKDISRAYEITQLVLCEMEEQFGTVMYPDLASYIQAKPQELLARLELYDMEENRFVKGYATKTSAVAHALAPPLPGQHSRAGSMDIREREQPRRDSNEGRVSKEGQDAMQEVFMKELQTYLETSKQSRTEKTLEAQRAGLQLLHSRQKSDALRILDPALRVIWATRWMERAKDRYDREVEKFEEQVATATELKQLHEGMGLDEYGSSSDEEEDGSSSDEEFTYVSFLQDIHRHHRDEVVQPTDEDEAEDEDSPTPGPRHTRTTSDIEARQRRRRTQLHGNYLHSPEDPTSPIEEQPKSEEVDGWLEMLSSGLAREKERQKQEAELTGRGSPSRKALRVDPTFDFDDDDGSPKKRPQVHSRHSSMSVFDSDSSEDENHGDDEEEEFEYEDEVDTGYEGDEFVKENFEFEDEEDAGYEGDASVEVEPPKGSYHAT